MGTILQAREDLIKKLNVMVRKIQNVTSFILTGSKLCPPSDVHVVIGTADSSAAPKIYSDINFLISEFLSPSSFNYTEDDSRIIKTYSFAGGVNAEVTVCGENNFPAADWWVSYLDSNGAAQAFYGDASKFAADPVTDQPKEDASDNSDDLSDGFTDDFDDDFDETPDIPRIVPTQHPSSSHDSSNDFYNKIDNEFQSARNKHTFSVPDTAPDTTPDITPLAEGTMLGEDFEDFNDFTVDEKLSEEGNPPETKPNFEETWAQIYKKVALAKGAISGGSIIRAGEVINELRTQLIELICNENGITDDYINSIDLLPTEYKKSLAKTYPSKLENGPVISALAAELSLFEQLIK